MSSRNLDHRLYAGDLYGDALSSPTPAVTSKIRELLPGVSLCVIASLAAAWISEHYGPPLVLMGLLVGLAMNFAATRKTHAGLDLISKTCLRWGIVLLGLQVTLAQISTVGLMPFVALLIVLAMTTCAALATARLVGLSSPAGLLAGGATAICGASAALAIYGVIGRERLGQAQFAVTLVAISLASAFAMLTYPSLAALLRLTNEQAGFLIGASIHDVAQAIGAGYAVSDEAGSYATIVKLARVALLAPYVFLASIALSKTGKAVTLASAARIRIPWFVVGFFAVVCLNSMFGVPAWAVGDALNLSKALLLLAVTATAMRSQPALMRQLGWRSALPVLTASIMSFLAALAFSLLLL